VAGKVKYEEAVKFADNLTYMNELLKVRGASSRGGARGSPGQEARGR
jgi:hypothetical protein